MTNLFLYIIIGLVFINLIVYITCGKKEAFGPSDKLLNEYRAKREKDYNKLNVRLESLEEKIHPEHLHSLHSKVSNYIKRKKQHVSKLQETGSFAAQMKADSDTKIAKMQRLQEEKKETSSV